MKLENDISKQFNLLSLDIFKTTHLKIDDRSMNGLDYLNKKYNEYTHLIEQSNLLRKKLKKDELCELNHIRKYISDTDSNSTEV